MADEPIREDLLRYDILAQDALRGVVRKVLAEVAKTGLPGEHHFYISFATHGAGVRVSSRLLAQYPTDMTIVLQHQYWDLTVTEHAFEVGLSFNGIPERLLVPFTAVKAFVDPSVQFALQFEPLVADAEATAPAAKPALAPLPAPERLGARKPRAERKPAEVKAKPDQAAEPAAVEPRPAEAKADVVSLDAFRKKN